jgi:enterochelin esterase-like enzyme
MLRRIHVGFLISLLTVTSLAVLAAAAQTPPPTGPGGAAGRAATRPSATVAPSADAIEVELAPPLTKDGNFKVAPKTRWADVPPIEVKEGTPRGTLSMFSVKSEDTTLFPGVNGSYVRNIWVYVPAGYAPGKELPLMVDHDGRADSVIQTQLIAVLDNLIAAKRLPMMAAVFIANGGDVRGRSERSLEYDTVSGKYAEYIENEILPLAEKTANVKFTHNPDGRGVIGQSSGSAAALAMAWFHNDWYHRVISYSGTFVNIKSGPDAPHGAWDYHERLIPQSEKNHIRIWMEVGSRDNGFNTPEASCRNWPLANNRMADVLKAKGYEYQYLWADQAGHVERGVERQTLAEAMEWVWKTY